MIVDAPPPDLSKIRFPVIRAVDVSGYALFPGTDGTGLSHSFPNGVSVIAGINGLGKTTLLNALLRLLLGPRDAYRENPADVGSTSHQLGIWRSPGFFANRVPDSAAGASISARISFGGEWAFVVRSLKDLSVVELRHGDQPLDPSEEAYQQLAVRLSGVETFYDFHFLVRNLAFYLEDRRPLLWSDDAQFEIARILFVPGTEATDLGRLYDEVKSVDSRYRNLLTESNRLVKRLKDERRAEAAAESVSAAVVALKDAFANTQGAIEEIEQALESAVDAERRANDDIRRNELELEAALREYEGLQHEFLAGAFPKASETLTYILGRLISDGGCMACGSKASERAAFLRTQLELGTCPVCESPAVIQERFATAGATTAAQLNGVAEQLKRQRQSLEGLAQSWTASSQEVDRLLEKRRGLQEQQREQRLKLAALGARVPTAQGAINQLEASVKVTQTQLESLAKTRQALLNGLRQLMAQVAQRIERAHLSVREHFQNYVQHFLAERCELNLRTRKRYIGESGQTVEFPGFDVLMTSGVFPDQPRPRETREDISESQKEFIDLAFRMALIKTATADGNGAMMVLETPEASLDSLFVYRAGGLLLRFAEAGASDLGNILIASSNLNAANMIPALLGIDVEPTRAAEVSTRVLNLLDLAAPNAALNSLGQAYRQQLAHALTPNPSRVTV